jgi:hypothetical protein
MLFQTVGEGHADPDDAHRVARGDRVRTMFPVYRARRLAQGESGISHQEPQEELMLLAAGLIHLPSSDAQYGIASQK